MLTHAKKTSLLAVLTAASIFTFTQDNSAKPRASNSQNSQSQQDSQPQQNNQSQNQSAPTNNSGNSDSGNGGDSGGGNDSLTNAIFDKKPGTGTFGSDAMGAEQEVKASAIADKALGRRLPTPEFLNFLAMDAVAPEQVKAYNDEIQNVVALLKENRLTDGWNELQKLSQFDTIDGGVSDTVAHEIEAVSNTNRTAADLKRQTENLTQTAATDARNSDLDATRNKENDLAFEQKAQAALGNGHQSNNQNNQGNNNNQANQSNQSNQSNQTSTNTVPNYQPPDFSTASQISTPGDNTFGKVELTTQYFKVMEDEGKIKYNQYHTAALQAGAKSQFADFISELTKTQRYQDVVIAADFWRKIFNEGDYPVSMAQQVTNSLEIQSKVRDDLDVVANNLSQQNVAAASDALQDAFEQSPHDPNLLSVPLKDKAVISSFLKKLVLIKSSLEARDFDGLGKLLTDIKQIAPDYDGIKATALVTDMQLASDLLLGKAKMFAQQDDLKTAMDDFKEAAQLWPGNPNLRAMAKTFFAAHDVENSATDDFDRLADQNNYRGIAEKQYVFAPAIADDKDRLAKFKDAMKKYELSETALAKAQAMVAAGDPSGAWETVEVAIKQLPDDNKLNSLRGDLSAQAAEFVSAINKAENAESRQDLGYSLTWYAIAQQQYPASQIANEAIKRLSTKILDKSSLADQEPSNDSSSSDDKGSSDKSDKDSDKSAPQTN